MRWWVLNKINTVTKDKQQFHVNIFSFVELTNQTQLTIRRKYYDYLK